MTKKRPTTTAPAVLGLTTAALGALAAGAGVLTAAPRPVEVFSARGQAVTLYGEGIYAWDTPFLGAGNRGTDAITLFLAVPFLVIYVIGVRRGCPCLAPSSSAGTGCDVGLASGGRS